MHHHIRKCLYALLNMSPAALLVLLKDRRQTRDFLYGASRLFRERAGCGLRTVGLEDLVPQRTWISIRYFAATHDLQEIHVLCSLLNVYKPKRIFEIGTFHGCTTAHLAANTDPYTRIHSLDLPPENGGELFRHAPGFWPGDVETIKRRKDEDYIRAFNLDDRIERLYGDSRAFDFSPYANQIDFVFIDGAHSYDYVRCDSNNALSMLSDRGIIVWHDYGEPGRGDSVNRAVEEFGARTGNTYHIRGSRLAIFLRRPPAIKYPGVSSSERRD